MLPKTCDGSWTAALWTLILSLTSLVTGGICESQEKASPCDTVVTLISFPKMVFEPIKPGMKVRPRRPVVKMTIKEDGSVSKVELLRSSRVKPWDKEVVQKIRKAKYNEAQGCGERLSEMTITIDYTFH